MNKNTTLRKKNNNIQPFLQEVILCFLQVLNSTKLFHWHTNIYAVHKATDDFYTKLNTNIDNFIEILLGKTNTRANLTTPTLVLEQVKTTPKYINMLIKFKYYLVKLNDNSIMNTMKNTDLFNIRDTILGDVNQLLYLLTFE